MGIAWRAGIPDDGGAIVMTGTFQKAVLGVVAPAGTRCIRVYEFDISFRGVSPTDPLILVGLYRATSQGTPVSSGQTPIPLKQVGTVNPQTDYFWDCDTSDQPSLAELFWQDYVHPQDSRHYRYPVGKEVVVRDDDVVVLMVLSTVSVPCKANIYGEE